MLLTLSLGCATRVRLTPAPEVLVLMGNAEVCESRGVCAKGAPVSETFAGLLTGVAGLVAEVFGDGPPPPPPIINIESCR